MILRYKTVFISVMILSLFIVCKSVSFASDPGFITSFQFENDFFGGGTDRHFTHGTRVEFLTEPIDWISDWAGKLPWFDSERSSDHSLKGRASISIGQNIYTPNDTFATQVVEDERPYAGWLYMGFGLTANQGSRRYDKIYLEAGIVGPSSYAKEIQKFWHSGLGIHIPEGWDNQLKDEPGAVLYYEQARRFDRKDIPFQLQVDFVPSFGGALGNVFTYATGGMTFRMGPDLKNDFGPPRIRPSLPGGSYFRPKEGINWYLFAGLEGRVVLRNIFLDGNSFRDSHSVEKYPLVGDIQAGLCFQWNSFRFNYIQIFRTKEFRNQNDPDIFGSLSLAYQFH